MPRNPNTIVNAWRGLESEGGDEGDEGDGVRFALFDVHIGPRNGDDEGVRL